MTVIALEERATVLMPQHVPRVVLPQAGKLAPGKGLMEKPRPNGIFTLQAVAGQAIIAASRL
jgi:hypothetical protein